MKRVVRVKALSDTPYLISEEAADVIGKGSYGKVVRAYNRTDASKRYAVKVFELNSLKEHRSGLQELSIVGKLPRNPNLVHYEKIKLTSKNCMYLVMEECNGGTLSQLLARSESLTDSEICQFVSDFVNGYRCLYECGIVHRDIKTDNVLLHDGRYKIADFGLSKIMQERSKTTSIRGSPVFLAPELFHKGTSGSKLDVYSFGVTLYYACYKRYPYTSRLRYVSMEELLADINRSELMLPTGRSDWL
jgi:serine/threonine protein kinase